MEGWLLREPFLRDLVMLLAVLLNDSSVWTKEDTFHLLHYFLKKEFQNASTVNSFTNIIPHIFQILVLMVWKRIGSSKEINQDFSLAEVNTGNKKEGTCQWLQRDLSGPPLILCQMEKASEWKLLLTNHC